MGGDGVSDRGTVERVGGAARGYSWPAAQPGNDLGKTHGAYSSALKLSTDPRVLELAEAIEATQPVSHPCDSGAIMRLALVYRRLELSTVALDQADEATAGKPVMAYADKLEWFARLRDDHARWLREAGRIEEQLARTPVSRAKLGLHLALGQRALTIVDLHEAAARDVAAVEGDAP